MYVFVIYRIIVHINFNKGLVLKRFIGLIVESAQDIS